MPRQVRIQYQDGIYHIMARGNRREPIFTDDEDRLLFLQTLEEACRRADFEVFAWVLMDNHYHLALRTPDANLVDGMSWLQNTYTRRFNARHKLWGRLFGDRYRAVLVEDDESVSASKRTGPGYLPTLIDYIHLNPARARIIRSRRQESIVDYPWSSLADGFIQPPSKRSDWLQVDEALDRLGYPDSSRGRWTYIEALDAQVAGEQADDCGVATIDGQSLQSTLRRGWYWGSEAFREKMLQKLDRKPAPPRSRNYRAGSQGTDAKLAKAESILSAGAAHFGIRPKSRIGQLARDDRRRVAIAWALCRNTSMPQRWIASKTALHTASNVSQQIRQFDALPHALLSPKERTWKARFSPS